MTKLNNGQTGVLSVEEEGKLDLLSVENGNPVLYYRSSVSFQKNVTISIENNRMNIEYDTQQSNIFIHTCSSYLQIPNNFRVIFVNDEIHFVKPGVNLEDYAEHAVLKLGSTNKSIPSSNITYTNGDNVQTNLETHLKDADFKISTTKL
jgi:hypothetical protein